MKKRIIGAIILLLIFIPLIMLGGLYFKIGATVLSALALKEILDIKDFSKNIVIISFILNILLVLFGVNAIIPFLIISFLIYIIEDLNLEDFSYLVSMNLLIALSFNAIIDIRSSLYMLLYILIITITTDSFALFSGMLFGKTKLTKISPKKTVEGLIGGLIFGTALSSVFYYYVIDKNIYIILISLLLCIICTMGDLIFSKIKRNFDKKDFSNILIGHGGILDRFDSIIFVALVFSMLKEIL